MARADSTIRVNIIGDAKGLSKEITKANKGIGGLGKGLIAGIGVAAVTDALFDFGQTALSEADRAGDAITRLDIQIGEDLTQSINDAASGMEDLGLSRQDVLELAADFADLATHAGIAEPLIADTADDVAAVAAAASLLGDQSPAEIVDLIGKAAGGSEKALKTLGINLSDAEVEARALKDSGKDLPSQLTDTELAGARLNIILEKMAPKLEAVRDGTGDVEQKQAELQARFETLSGKIGEGLEGPLNDFLGWVLSGVDGLGQLEFGIGEVIDQMILFLGPIGQAIDGLRTLLGLINQVPGTVAVNGPHVPNRPGVSGGSGGTSSSAAIVNAVQEYQERNGEPII